MSNYRKVLIIGLDGFDLRLARSLMREGVMPNFSGILQRGCYGELESVLPFETASAWTAFQTGCYPGKTGIFTFHCYDRVLPRVRSYTASDIAVPTLWELADKGGKRYISVNMPMTWPASPGKGIVIPGLMCPEISSETVTPRSVHSRYLAGLRNYDIVSTRSSKTSGDFVDQQINTERIRCQLACRLMQEEAWDVFCVQIQSTDYLQHRMWRYLDSAVPGYSVSGHQEVVRFYQACDEIIGRLVRQAGSDVLHVLLSDHGFRREEHIFYINSWLREQGYLHLSEAQIRQQDRQDRKQRLKTRIPLLRPVARFYGRIKSSFNRHDWVKEDLSRVSEAVDLPTSRAIVMGTMAGLLYIRGDADQRRLLGQEIRERLLGEFGPESDSAVVIGITRGEEYFSPAQGDRVPDWVVELRSGVTLHTHPCSSEVLFTADRKASERPIEGTHDRRGFWAACGRGIHAGKAVDCKIVDILPTILAAIELPIPDHIDGRVIREAFVDPISFQMQEGVPAIKDGVEISDNEQKKIEKRLKDLGYL